MKPSPAPISGLLPWQVLLLFFAAGCLATAFPLPAIVAALLIFGLVRWCGVASRVLPFILITLLGCCYTWFRLPHAPQPKNQHLTTVQPHQRTAISGVIQDIQWRFANHLYLFADNVYYKGNRGKIALPGILLISVDNAETAPIIGQRFQTHVRLRPVHSLKNPGCWDGEAYWNRQGVFWRTYIKNLSVLSLEPASEDILDSLRWHLRNRITTILPQGKGRGLTLALLLGDKSGLDRTTYELMQQAGLAHSLALSGLHLGFMVCFGWMLAWGLGWLFPAIYLFLPRPKLAVFLGIPCVVFYMWLGGCTPSLLRAGIMFASWGVLLLMNRNRVLIDGLFFAVFFILLWSPGEIFSLSLQFSVLAVAGIILLVPPLQKRLTAWARGNKYRRLLTYPCVVMLLSLAANVALLPLQVWHFGTLTPHLYYNILWIPLLGFILLPLGFMGLFLACVPGLESIVIPGLAHTGLGSNILLLVNMGMNQWCELLLAARDAGWLQTIQSLRPRWPEILGFYTMLSIALVLWNQRKTTSRQAIPLFASALLLLVFPTVTTTIAATRQKCRVLVMDTGMSQAVLVELAGGERLLVDGGGSWNRDFDVGKTVVVPSLSWGRPPKVNKVLLSHSDCDHLRGLIYPLATCNVEDFYWNGRPPAGSWDMKSLTQTLRHTSIPVHLVRAGMHIDIDKRTRLEILHPQGDVFAMSRNDGSLVLRLVVDGKGLVLIPGDIEKKGIEALLEHKTDLQADLLILPHHGSGSSLSEMLYDRVDPRLAVAAAGWNNRYGFPAEEVVKSLKKRGIKVMSTGTQGAIEIIWPQDKDGMRVRPQRLAPFFLAQ